jgi:hypothetical protein
MSHEITVRKDGTEEFFAAGSTPVWHRLGQRVERALSSGAALRMAALDWKVDERPQECRVVAASCCRGSCPRVPGRYPEESSSAPERGLAAAPARRHATGRADGRPAGHRPEPIGRPPSSRGPAGVPSLAMSLIQSWASAGASASFQQPWPGGRE